ncbi:MAG: hypothetical protein ACRDHK_12945 [Actinomycetota bacterium]
MEADARTERARPGPLRGSPGLKDRIREAAGSLAAMRDVVPIRAGSTSRRRLATGMTRGSMPWPGDAASPAADPADP